MSLLKKIIKYSKIVSIDVHIYRITRDTVNVSIPDINMPVDVAKVGSKVMYSIMDDSTFVHSSFLYKSVNLLKLVKKKGPAIGNCGTNPNYRGRSIYPFVINKIAKEVIAEGKEEVFIIVNSDNVSSIKGILKAGFKLYAEIRCKRFLLYCFDVKTIYHT